MEFIVEQQAAMNVRQDSILKLIEGEMKLIAGHDRRIAALAEGHKELIAAQKATEETVKGLAGLHADTERKLNRLIETLSGGSNGRQTP